MLPFATGAAASTETGASFVYTYSGGGGSVGSHGAIAGDLILAATSDGSVPTLAGGGAGFVNMGSGLSYCVLVAGNLANAVSSGATLIYTIFRGAASAHIVVTSSIVGSVAGFTKNVKHCGLAAYISAPTGAAPDLSSPATWAVRQNFDSVFAGTLRMWLGDRLNPVNPLYVNSAAFVWGIGGGGGTKTLTVFELRTA